MVLVRGLLSATEAPNYYCTRDFKDYTPLTKIAPELKYNWLTTELVRWETSYGGPYAGILYKPENFDSSKKYPIIFYLYERLSDRLNEYLEPEAGDGRMNIPYFVSNGYLVFTPDIYYKIGRPGESAYNSVISAAKYLARMPWVDSTKMGIQGISWGAYQVNYLVANNNLFAAAASSAGVVDFISAYGGLMYSGISNQFVYETNQSRMGSTLWQNPDLYFKNSPILKANEVQTPLLIMHNKKDDSVPWQQGVELFTALRRLGKKVWMLQYDNGGHGIGGKDAVDYTIRLSQFFDHYLKGALPPKWMTIGVPARLKGIERGYELDRSSKRP